METKHTKFLSIKLGYRSKRVNARVCPLKDIPLDIGLKLNVHKTSKRTSYVQSICV